MEILITICLSASMDYDRISGQVIIALLTLCMLAKLDCLKTLMCFYNIQDFILSSYGD